MAVSITSPYSVETLREWAPLTDLLSKIPTKSQIGLFAQDVKLTCIDVLPEFIAVGTNIGVVFWYDRLKKDMQRLRCEKQNVHVTVVKIISTVDYMVACGTANGYINIFQIPKSHPSSIPENLKPKFKQVERYTVSELHKSRITAIEWSKNGMKLFSGDKSGCIVLTEIDFYMHICKSVEILNESYPVVQLSYNNQRLLISTTYRSIICEKLDKWKVCQVGKKDRKILGNFGGVIYQNGPKAADACLYCTRPGLRIWIADCEGNVNKTLLFKDLLKQECLEVPIINPISKSLKQLKPQKEPSFGIVLSFNSNLLLTYNNDVIYVLDPQSMSVISTMSHFRSVLSVAAYKDEIFVLEEDRSIIRISYQPETNSDLVCQSPSTSFLPLTSTIKDLTNKLQSTTIIPAISPFAENSNGIMDFNIHTDTTLIVNAEEAQESPIKQQKHSVRLDKKFDDIGKQEFSDKILFKSNKQRKKTSIMSASLSSLSSNSSEEKDVNFLTKPTLMSLSSIGVLPDLRSPESIQNDIEYKEKILADILNFDKVKIATIEEVKDEQIQMANNEVKIKDETVLVANGTKKPNEDSKQNIPKSSFSTIKKVEKPKNAKITAPACVEVPNEWKLGDIKLNTSEAAASLSDNSLTDWEIV